MKRVLKCDGRDGAVKLACGSGARNGAPQTPASTSSTALKAAANASGFVTHGYDGGGDKMEGKTSRFDRFPLGENGTGSEMAAAHSSPHLGHSRPDAWRRG